MKTKLAFLFLSVLCACTSTSHTSDPVAVDVDAAPVVATLAQDAAVSPDGGGGPDAAAPRPARGPRDRAGRPLVSQLLTSPANRDLYNTDEMLAWPSAVPPEDHADGAAPLGADFQSRLVALDALDGVDDWKGGVANAPPDPDAGVYPHPLANAWLTDVLVVDPQMPFSPAGYLDVESDPDNHTTCGGRWLADDAIDKTLSYLVGKKTSGVSDGVGAATRAPSLTFPYLAPPN